MINGIDNWISLMIILKKSNLEVFLFYFIFDAKCQSCMQVISGIEAAVRSMKVGSIRRVIIPPSQGYQNTSQEPIPPNVCSQFFNYIPLRLCFG